MMCTTVLHGGVCHRASTPHKSGIKMKEKQGAINFNSFSGVFLENLNSIF